MWLTRRYLLSLGILGCTVPRIGPAWAGPPLPSGRIALRGFDVVSYFLDSPEPGLTAYEAAWIGQTWRFARAANRDAFRADPEAYLPRLGGFDPVGIVAGRLVDTDPLVFARFPGPGGAARLYLLRDARSRAAFLTDSGIAGAAEARWPALRDQIERDFPN